MCLKYQITVKIDVNSNVSLDSDVFIRGKDKTLSERRGSRYVLDIPNYSQN
jgi:hypothetical protein